MKIKEDRTALTFLRGNKSYHFASIKLSRERSELFYIFQFLDKKRLVDFTNYEPSRPEQSKVRLPDHISFHRDGTTHLAYKNAKGQMEYGNRIKLRNNPFLVDPLKWAPLMFHSVYGDQEKSLPSQISDHGHNRELSIQSKTDRFTVVLFSVGDKIDVVEMLNTHFPGVFELHAVFGNIWKPIQEAPVTNLLVAISAKALFPSQGELSFSFGLCPPEQAIRGITH